MTRNYELVYYGNYRDTGVSKNAVGKNIFGKSFTLVLHTA